MQSWQSCRKLEHLKPYNPCNPRQPTALLLRSHSAPRAQQRWQGGLAAACRSNFRTRFVAGLLDFLIFAVPGQHLPNSLRLQSRPQEASRLLWQVDGGHANSVGLHDLA